MIETRENMYKTCRLNAGLTQEATAGLLANDEMNSVTSDIKRIMSDGIISDDEIDDYAAAIELVKTVNAKLLSVIIYAGTVKNTEGDERYAFKSKKDSFHHME